MKKRIWELDALRGLGILIMVGFHLWYDLVYLFGVVPQTAPKLFGFVGDWAGVVFLVISGICVTFGSRPVRRGLTVFLGGLLCTAVTVGMYVFQFAGKDIIIYFGVLHCLGVCMLLWPLLKKLPWPVLAVLGVCMIAGGLYLKNNVRVSFPWLMPLGVPYWGFASSDYFPILPNLGYFLCGAAVGRTLYAKKESLLPRLDGALLTRPLCFLGRHSLLIYLLHQPVLAAAVWLILLF